jgi:imidazole glycerol-phosphate synthase subunit HisF
VLKKRIIFTLLYDSGHFMLSRNFRLQRVGDIRWLQKNYNFSQIAYFIDELVVLDVSRQARQSERFCEALKQVASGCFVPIAAGGGVRTVEHARALLRSGADKVVVNSALFSAPDLVQQLAQEFGQQCVVGSIDAKCDEAGQAWCWTDNGQTQQAQPLTQVWPTLLKMPIGELYLNSIYRDGTGQGYDMGLLDSLPTPMPIPVIFAGGVGNALHLAQGLQDERVDAVATAHLFNFVGDGLARARAQLLAQGFSLASWPSPDAMAQGANLG